MYTRNKILLVYKKIYIFFKIWKPTIWYDTAWLKFLFNIYI